MKKGKTAKDVDEYIGNQQPEAQEILQQLRKTILKAAPQAEESISYGMPAYKWNGVLVYFGCYETHIGFYPTGQGISAFEKELASYDYSKGTIRFPWNKPLPVRLISKIVKYRMRENGNKRKALKK